MINLFKRDGFLDKILKHLEVRYKQVLIFDELAREGQQEAIRGVELAHVKNFLLRKVRDGFIIFALALDGAESEVAVVADRPRKFFGAEAREVKVNLDYIDEQEKDVLC